MAAGIYAARKTLKTLLVSTELGGQVSFTSDIENYLGRTSIRGMELARSFEEHLRQYEIDISLGETVKTIERENRDFRVTADSGKSWVGEAVIVASGARWRTLDVPGERDFWGRGVSYCATCDGPLYRGRTVAVVGGGNSGLTAVIDLLAIAERVYLIELLETLQADPILIDRVSGAEKLEVLLHHRVEAIGGADNAVENLTVKNLTTGRSRTIQLDGVFVEIGTVPNSDFVSGLLERNPRGEIVTDIDGKTNVPGVFAAGDATAGAHRQIIIAAGQGAGAGLSAYTYLLHKR